MEFNNLLYSSIALGGIIFGFSLYKSPKLLRKTLETSFKSYDYFYNKFYNIWYDEKIRIHEIPLELNVYKKMKEINSNLLISNKYLKIEFEDNIDIYTKEERNELISFLTKDVEFKTCSYKSSNYYLFGSKLNNNNYNNNNDIIANKDFLNNFISCPWLAISIELETLDTQTITFDITEKFKQFWVLCNQLPFSIYYYDLWISYILFEMNIPHYEIPQKFNLKRNIKLIIIDETGDFIEYSNVLIIPRPDKPIIINLEPNLENNLETIIEEPRDEPRDENNQKDEPRDENNQKDEPRDENNQKEEPRDETNQKDEPRDETNQKEELKL